MNRAQKMAWWMVVWIGMGLTAAAIGVVVLHAKVGFPRAWSGLGLLGVCGFSGLAPLIFRKDPGAVQFDERDRDIQLKSARAGFAMSYLVFGLLAMGIWTYCRWQDMAMVSIEVLPMMWALAAIIMFFSGSLATLFLYGKNNKTTEGGAA